MKNFNGFPTNMQFTPIPNLFLNMFMPGMGIHELKCMLVIFQIIYAKKGSPRYVSLSEILANITRSDSMRDATKPTYEIVMDVMASAVERRTIISIEVTLENRSEYLYFLNTQSNRLAVERIRCGKLILPEIETVKPVSVPVMTKNVFSLYEENIGLLTPMIAEELKDALMLYSEEWIQDAIRKAVYANKRNWSYVSRILERWASEGRKDGTHQQNNTQEDSDKYISGQYGHLIHR